MRRGALGAWYLLVGVFLVAPLCAQDEEPVSQPPMGEATPVSQPPADAAGEAAPGSLEAERSPAAAGDRLSLVGGEVLQGEILSLVEGKLDFASEGVGKTQVPWEKVEAWSAGKAHVYRLVSGEDVQGPAQGEGGQFIVSTADGARTFTRGDLLLINPAPPKTEVDFWSTQITLGLTATFGNSRTRTTTNLFSVQRDDGEYRVLVSGVSTYGEDSNQEETAKSHRADAQFDIELGEFFYLTPFVGSASYDKFQNIELRFLLAAGFGVWVVKIPDTFSLQVETGAGYAETRYRRVQPGVRDREESFSLRFATRISYQLAENIFLKVFFETYVGTEDIEDTVHHGEGLLSFKFSYFSFDVGLVYDRVERPRRTNDGRLPHRDDAKLVAGLGVAF